MKSALAAIEADDERTLRDQIELTEIPAPPFKEAVRAAEYTKRLQALGFADARVDKEGNVIAVRKGNGKGPLLVVSAHLDTVFPEGTTGDGRALLPFRSTLLAAVAPAAAGTAVRSVAIDYGAAVDDIAWHGGEKAIANALRVLGRKGTLAVTVRLLDALPPGEDRKVMARDARAAIAAALGQMQPGPK